MMLGWVTSLIMTASTVLHAPSITPDQLVFRHDTLRPGTAGQAGLLPGPGGAMREIAESSLAPTADHPDQPAYAGATVLAARNGVVVRRFAVGDAVRYSAPDAELP